MKIEIVKINESYIKVYSDVTIETEIRDYFTFKAPGYQFSPKYKARVWDGNISLYNIKTKQLPIGLYPRLLEFCSESNIEVHFKECERYSCVYQEDDISFEEIQEFVNDLNLYSRNEPIAARDYQVSAIQKAVNQKRITLISPTSCLDPDELLNIYLSDESKSIKIKDIKQLLDNGLSPYIDSPTGKVRITDYYEKTGPGFELTFDDNTSFKCAERHKMFNGNEFIDAVDMNINDSLYEKVLIKKVEVPSQVWSDFSVDAEHETYIHKGIIHHNSGKSLIIYSIIRYILEENPESRVLLLVPNVQLVNQMFGDFLDYSSQNGWDVEKNCQKLYSGQSRELSKRVLITTWQSFTRIASDKVNGPKILSLYKAVISDEAHGSKSTEMQSILEKCTHAAYRIGTTGTLDTSPTAKVHQLQIEGFLGPIHKVITTKELMDSNQVSNLKIKTFVLKYSEDDCRLLKNAEYQDEIKWLISNSSRNAFIMKLALVANGTTLILVNHRDTHAKKLYEALSKVSKNKVYYVSGTVDPAERERIRKLANEQTCIIVATMATMSTGVSIPNIRNVIFGCPSKSSIRVLQSIGRGLRLHTDKEYMTLYDIIDDLRHKKKENFSYQHGIERFAIYRREKFEISVKEMPL